MTPTASTGQRLYTEASSYQYSVHFSHADQVETYANNSDLQWNAAMKVLARYGLKGHESIVDFGCGDGKITHFLSEKTTGTVLGFDISTKMIAAATTAYMNDNLDFEEGDIVNFTSENQYDLAYAGYSLHYVDAPTALQRLFDVLKPGGSALITMPGKYEKSLASYSDKLSKTKKWGDRFIGFENKRKYYNVEEFTLILHDAGFIPQSVQAIEQKMEFIDRQAIRDFYLPVSAHAKFLPEELREEFIDDLITNVLTENGSISAPKPFIYQNTLEVIALRGEVA